MMNAEFLLSKAMVMELTAGDKVVLAGVHEHALYWTNMEGKGYTMCSSCNEKLGMKTGGFVCLQCRNCEPGRYGFGGFQICMRCYRKHSIKVGDSSSAAGVGILRGDRGPKVAQKLTVVQYIRRLMTMIPPAAGFVSLFVVCGSQFLNTYIPSAQGDCITALVNGDEGKFDERVLVFAVLVFASAVMGYAMTVDCWRLGIMKRYVCTVQRIVFSDSETLTRPSAGEGVVHLRYMPVLPADTIIVYGAQGGAVDAVIVDMKRTAIGTGESQPSAKRFRLDSQTPLAERNGAPVTAATSADPMAPVAPGVTAGTLPGDALARRAPRRAPSDVFVGGQAAVARKPQILSASVFYLRAHWRLADRVGARAPKFGETIAAAQATQLLPRGAILAIDLEAQLAAGAAQVSPAPSIGDGEGDDGSGLSAFERSLAAELGGKTGQDELESFDAAWESDVAVEVCVAEPAAEPCPPAGPRARWRSGALPRRSRRTPLRGGAAPYVPLSLRSCVATAESVVEALGCGPLALADRAGRAPLPPDLGHARAERDAGGRASVDGMADASDAGSSRPSTRGPVEYADDVAPHLGGCCVVSDDIVEEPVGGSAIEHAVGMEPLVADSVGCTAGDGHSGSECGFVSFLGDFSVAAVARAAQGPKSGVESLLDWAEARALSVRLGSAAFTVQRRDQSASSAGAMARSPRGCGGGSRRSMSYWMCSCGEWNWGWRTACLGCGGAAPPWALESAAAKAKPQADKARRAATSAASTKSRTSASAASETPSGSSATAIERLQATVAQLEALHTEPPDGVDSCFTDVVGGQLEAKRAELFEAQRAAAEQKAPSLPLSTQLHKEANAIGKAQKRLRAARLGLEQKQAARNIAEAQLQKAQEELAMLDAGVEEASRALHALEEAAREEAEAQQRQRAVEWAGASQVPGLLMQLDKLPEAWGSSNFDVAWAAIRAQVEAVRALLAEAPAGPKRAPWAESCPMGDFSSEEGDHAGGSRPWQPQCAAVRGQAEQHGDARGEWPKVAQACKRELAAEAADLGPLAACSAGRAARPRERAGPTDAGPSSDASSGLQQLARSLYRQDALGPKDVDLCISTACGDTVLSACLPWSTHGNFSAEPGALQERMVSLDARPDAAVQVLVGPGRLPDISAAACRPCKGTAVRVRRRVGCTRWQVESCCWPWVLGSLPSALDEAVRQWVKVVGGALVGIHGADVGDLSRDPVRSEGPKVGLRPLCAVAERGPRHRRSARARAFRQALGGAIQGLTADGKQRLQPMRVAWCFRRVERLSGGVEAAAAVTCEGDEVEAHEHGNSEWGDRIGQAGVHERPEALAALQRCLAGSQRRDGSKCSASWSRAAAKEAVHKGDRLARRPAKAAPPPQVEDPGAGGPVAGLLAAGQLEANWQAWRQQEGARAGAGVGCWDVQCWTLQALSLEMPQAVRKRDSPTAGLDAEQLTALGAGLIGTPDVNEEEIAACSKGGACTVLGSRSGAAPCFNERHPDGKTDKSGRSQRSVWLRALHPGGRPRAGRRRAKGEGIPALHAQERCLEWLGIAAELAVCALSAASGAGSAPAAAAASAAAAGSPCKAPAAAPAAAAAACQPHRSPTTARAGLLGAFWITEEELPAAAGATADALEGRRVSRRLARCGAKSASVRKDIAFYDNAMTGQLNSRLNNDLRQAVSPVSIIINSFLANIVVLVIGFAICFNRSWKLTVLAFTVLSPMIHITTEFSKWASGLMATQYTYLADAQGAATQTLTNIRTVHSFSAQQMEQEQFELHTRKAMKVGLRSAWGMGGADLLSGLVQQAASFIVLFYGGHLALGRDGLEVGTIITFTLLWGNLSSAFKSLNNNLNQPVKAMSAGQRVFEVLDLQPDISTQGADTALGQQLGHIEVKLDHVEFTYQSRPDKKVLQSASLTLAAGKTTAVVGKSGCGKSTIAKLLMRFYDPQGGSVTLNGIDLRDMPLHSLRSNIGIVSQDTQLFRLSIRENITYGLRDGSYGEEDVERAAALANADEFIRALPEADIRKETDVTPGKNDEEKEVEGGRSSSSRNMTTSMRK
ncbi:unnamed protein product [Prorocentrum cordatum]|uniref:ABC transmembrane type-1 domain-containing protein n=1 Tax=Prorocentrum cordatum TaxID=2364126 RepID=A0ABN9S1P0_9DINO|nr:unnamed protein product [Polarella glacialis]